MPLLKVNYQHRRQFNQTMNGIVRNWSGIVHRLTTDGGGGRGGGNRISGGNSSRRGANQDGFCGSSAVI